MNRRIALSMIVVIGLLAISAQADEPAKEDDGRVRGHVAKIEGDELTVKLKPGSGEQVIKLTEQTSYFEGDTRATKDAVVVGQKVVILLRDDGTAANVVVTPERKKTKDKKKKG